MSARTAITHFLRLVGALLVLALMVLLMAVTSGSWLVFLLLLIPAHLIGEWTFGRLFGPRGPFEQLSTSVVGFSVQRIVIGLFIAVPLFFALLGLVLGKEFFRTLNGW